MELSERKEKILQAIIDDYIMTAEPVGSAYILNSHNLGVSSATVRNEMAALEEAGYLEKPHTSAGRVPSVLGYRTYVNRLMREYRLTINEINQIKIAFAKQYVEFNKILKTMSDMMSVLTNYTTVFTTPVSSKYVIYSVKLIGIDEKSFVMIVVLSDGVVKNRTLRVKNPYDSEVLEKLSKYLNKKFAGVSLNALSQDILDEEKELIPVDGFMLDIIFKFLSDLVADIDDCDIILSGTTNIFKHPEFNDINRTRDFLQFMRNDNGKEIKEILKKSQQDKDISVIIGGENPQLEEHDLSMVVSNYNLGNDLFGKMAIIGPTRMDYAKVISTLDYFSKHLKDLNNNGPNGEGE